MFWALLRAHFNPRLAARVKVSLSWAQIDTFIPADTNFVVLLSQTKWESQVLEHHQPQDFTRLYCHISLFMYESVPLVTLSFSFIIVFHCHLFLRSKSATIFRRQKTKPAILPFQSKCVRKSETMLWIIFLFSARAT